MSAPDQRTKRAANQAVKRALRRGMLPARPLCAVCRSRLGVVWHHHSYAKEDWLQVTPLCWSHHQQVHNQQMPEPWGQAEPDFLRLWMNYVGVSSGIVAHFTGVSLPTVRRLRMDTAYRPTLRTCDKFVAGLSKLARLAAQ